MDLRVIKTKKSICDSLLSLLENKPSNKITVCEVTKLANIERKTFYLHYSCIDDVYSDIEKNIETDLNIEADKYIKDPNHNIRNIYKNLSAVILKNIKFFKSISINDSYSFFKHSFEKILAKIIDKIGIEIYHIKSNNLSTYSSFYSSGIVKLYMDWLKGSLKITITELENILSRVSFLSFDDLIKPH